MSAEIEELENQLSFYWTTGASDLAERLAELAERGWTPATASPEPVIYQGAPHLLYRMRRTETVRRPR